MKPRIMYIEDKSADGLAGPARIGRVTFSKSGRSFYYDGRRFKKVHGFLSNCIDVETGASFWITGCKRRGGDRLYPGHVEIDDDVREEYWTEIRGMPEAVDQSVIRCIGKYGGKQPK